METDDDDDAAGFETIEQDAAEGCFELFELAIDGDAQGLKDLSRGMTPGSFATGRLAMPSLARSAARRRPAYGAFTGNRIDQVETCEDRPGFAPFDDTAGHAAAV